MIIKEVRQLYSLQIKSYREQQVELAKQKKELETKIDMTPDGKHVYANEAAVLELTIQAVDEKQNEYQAYMDKLTEQWTAITNMISAKQQEETMEEYAIDMGKIMEVAGRLMKGAIVPATDEKKLMEYSMELYQAAKNMGALAKQKEKEEYDSLWDDEEESEEVEEPTEVADNTETFAEGPEIVEVADVMTSVADSSD